MCVCVCVCVCVCGAGVVVHNGTCTCIYTVGPVLNAWFNNCVLCFFAHIAMVAHVDAAEYGVHLSINCES